MSRARGRGEQSGTAPLSLPGRGQGEGPRLSRREMLHRSGLGLGMLGLAGLVSPDALAANLSGTSDGLANPMTPKAPHFAAKAKHVIHIFANGGPSHVDTFDPKPSLAARAGQMLPMENLRDRAQDRRGLSLAVQVPEIWAKRNRGQRAVLAHGGNLSTTWRSSARCTPTCPITSRR